MDQEDDFLISFNELDPLVAFPLQSDNPPTQNPPVCYMDNVAPAAAGRSIAFPGSDFGLAAGEDHSFFFDRKKQCPRQNRRNWKIMKTTG